MTHLILPPLLLILTASAICWLPLEGLRLLVFHIWFRHIPSKERRGRFFSISLVICFLFILGGTALLSILHVLEQLPRFLAYLAGYESFVVILRCFLDVQRFRKRLSVKTEK